MARAGRAAGGVASPGLRDAALPAVRAYHALSFAVVQGKSSDRPTPSGLQPPTLGAMRRREISIEERYPGREFGEEYLRSLARGWRSA